MLRSENFNEVAMEEKIKLNLAKDFTIATIKETLKAELLVCLKIIKSQEIRAIELYDQVDYIDEKFTEVKDANSA